MPPFVPFAPANIARLVGPDATDPGANEVVASNQDLILAWVNAQRQNVQASSIEIHKSFLSTPDFDVTYRNEFGAEIVEIRPYVKPTVTAEETTSQSTVTGTEEVTFDQPVLDIEEPMLLVLYGTNKIAAIPMSQIGGSGGLAPVYTATLSTAAWGDQPINSTQLQFTKANATIFAPIDFVKLRTSPTFFIMSEQLTDGLKGSTASTAVPVLNASKDGATIYAPSEIFSLANGVYKITATMPNSTPYAIDTSGVYYYQGGGGLIVTTPTSSIDSPPSIDTQLASVIDQVVYGEDLAGYISEYVPGDGSYQITMAQLSTPNPEKVPLEGVSNYSYHIEARRGVGPTIQEFRASTVGDLVIHGNTVGAEVGPDKLNFTGTFPMPMYVLPAGSGVDKIVIVDTPFAYDSTVTRFPLTQPKISLNQGYFDDRPTLFPTSPFVIDNAGTHEDYFGPPPTVPAGYTVTSNTATTWLGQPSYDAELTTLKSQSPQVFGAVNGGFQTSSSSTYTFLGYTITTQVGGVE